VRRRLWWFRGDRGTSRSPALSIAACPAGEQGPKSRCSAAVVSVPSITGRRVSRYGSRDGKEESCGRSLRCRIVSRQEASQ
jgi:hypothetical protein